MPKLAIYVPKKDMRQIERWRKEINFSQVFMKAVLAEIRQKERWSGASGDNEQVASAAEFYRRKLVEEGGDGIVEYGHSIGLKHVLECRLSPVVIRRMVEIHRSDELGKKASADVAEAVGEDLKEADALAERGGYDPTSQPAWRSALYRGYVSGVASAWEKVCEQMKSD